MQLTPTVSAADVERVVRRDFPAERVAEVWAILNEYGSEGWQRELDRVRLAALKLAAGDMEMLRRHIETAKQDYRDVLAYAEHPGYMSRVPGPGTRPPDEVKRIVDADWKQYQDWLTR